MKYTVVNSSVYWPDRGAARRREVTRHGAVTPVGCCRWLRGPIIPIDEMEPLERMLRRESVRAASFAPLPQQRDVIDDLMSEGWLAVIQDRGRFIPGRSSVQAFMFKRVRGAMHNWLRWMRSRGITQHPLSSLVSMSGESYLAPARSEVPSAFDEMVGAERLNSLMAACRTERDRQIIRAMRDGFNQREIAAMYGISQSRVMQIKARILEAEERLVT